MVEIGPFANYSQVVDLQNILNRANFCGGKFSWSASFEIFAEINFTDLYSDLANSAPFFTEHKFCTPALIPKKQKFFSSSKIQHYTVYAPKFSAYTIYSSIQNSTV